MPSKSEDKNLHKGHRERLRKKFLDSNGDILESHELIELLLYYVNAQRNTNEIARSLIKKYGSIYNIFEADPQELMSVKGIGEQGAALLKLQSVLLRKYNIDRDSHLHNMKMTPKNSGKYITNFFRGYSNEVLMMFCLNSECKIINAVPVSKGSVDRVLGFIRDIVKLAIDVKATYVIMAHNHPNGSLTPSPNDIDFTIELEKALAFVNIRLIDHVIVVENKYVSLANEFDIFK